MKMLSRVGCFVLVGIGLLLDVIPLVSSFSFSCNCNNYCHLRGRNGNVSAASTGTGASIGASVSVSASASYSGGRGRTRRRTSKGTRIIHQRRGVGTIANDGLYQELYAASKDKYENDIVKSEAENDGDGDGDGDGENKEEKDSPIAKSNGNDNDVPVSAPSNSPSLDTILERARKRPLGITILPYKIQAVMNRPLVNIRLPFTSFPSMLTIGDSLLILVAVQLNSIGFAFGYGIGKLSVQFLRENSNVFPISIAFIELWPVILSVGLDVLWRNI